MKTHICCAGLNRGGLPVNIRIRVVSLDDPRVIKQELVAARGPKLAFTEDMPNLRRRAVHVVGVNFDDHGHLVGRVPLEDDVLHEQLLAANAGALLDRYSLRATRFILEKAREFASRNGKQLMVVLFDPYRAMTELRQNGTRYDQEIVDYLVREKFTYFDMNEIHLRDFQKYRIPFEEDRQQYFIGHYSPRGNHFFAYAIKDKIVEWLEPKPVTYRQADSQAFESKGYLNER